jgi:DNA-binding NarL/FixJ family response regulator
MVPTRILIADDHPIARLGLRQILEDQTNWKVVAEVEDGDEAIKKTLQLKPDVVLMDIAMPGIDGLEACRRIIATAPQTKILILTIHDIDTMIMEVLNAGAKGYVLKTDASRYLVAAVEAVRGGKSFFTARISKLIADGYLATTGKSRRRHDKVFLSPRQQQVLELIAAGCDTREIASTLKVTLKTAETHRANLMRRLNCNSISQVSRYAFRNELIRA